MNKMLAITLIVISLIGISGCLTSDNNTEVVNEIDLGYAISLGLPLGVLAAKYAPWLPEEPGDAQRRELYTSLLQNAVDDLNIILKPSPASLLSSGRGQKQYDVIESYFEQILTSDIAERSQCMKYTLATSANSAWLILMSHEAPYVKDEQEFKQNFLWRLDQFPALATVASMACEEEGFIDYSANLRAVSEDVLDWETHILLNDDNEIASDAQSFGKYLSDWLVYLTADSIGNPTRILPPSQPIPLDEYIHEATWLANFDNKYVAQMRFYDAIKQYPDEPKAHYVYGNFLFNFFSDEPGGLDLAEVELRSAIKLDPNYAPAYYDLGRVLMAKGSTVEAEEAFHKYELLQK